MKTNRKLTDLTNIVIVIIHMTIMALNITYADKANEFSGASVWNRSRSSYRFYSDRSMQPSIPRINTPKRVVYDALAAVNTKNYEDFSLLFAEEDHKAIREFYQTWENRLNDHRLVDLNRSAINKGTGVAYVGLLGHVFGHGANYQEAFADVVFLKRSNKTWKLSLDILDVDERDNVLRSLNILRVMPPGAETEQRRRMREWSERADRRSHARAYEIGMKMMGQEFTEEDVERDYQRQLARSAYRTQRSEAGTLPKTLREVIELYDVEIFDPPVCFDVTKELEVPSFASWLDAVQASFYLGMLQHPKVQRNHGMKLLDRLGWDRRSPEAVEIHGGLPEYLPHLTPLASLTSGGLNLVQIRARIPFAYQEQHYQIILLTMIETDDSIVERVPIFKDGPKALGHGRLYLKKERGRWIPSRDLGEYPGFTQVQDWFRPDKIYGRRNTVWSHVKERALQILDEEEGWPLPLRRFYTADECIDIDEARKLAAHCAHRIR